MKTMYAIDPVTRMPYQDMNDDEIVRIGDCSENPLVRELSNRFFNTKEEVTRMEEDFE